VVRNTLTNRTHSRSGFCWAGKKALRVGSRSQPRPRVDAPERPPGRAACHKGHGDGSEGLSRPVEQPGLGGGRWKREGAPARGPGSVAAGGLSLGLSETGRAVRRPGDRCLAAPARLPRRPRGALSGRGPRATSRTSRTGRFPPRGTGDRSLLPREGGAVCLACPASTVVYGTAHPRRGRHRESSVNHTPGDAFPPASTVPSLLSIMRGVGLERSGTAQIAVETGCGAVA
jgi:hypothetical protein